VFSEISPFWNIECLPTKVHGSCLYSYIWDVHCTYISLASHSWFIPKPYVCLIIQMPPRGKAGQEPIHRRKEKQAKVKWTCIKIWPECSNWPNKYSTVIKQVSALLLTCETVFTRI
jgi:hypothetical protein